MGRPARLKPPARGVDPRGIMTTLPAAAESDLDRRLRLAVLLVLLIALMAAVLKIIDYGFVPPDDALRHAATAVGDRPYHEVLLFDEAIPAEDSTPGWHAVLRTVHRVTGFDQYALVSLSIVFFFGVFTITPLFLLKRPEAWGIVLMLAIVANPGMAYRLALGRPFLLSATAVMVFVLIWQRLVDDPRSRPALLACVAVAMITTWLHSTWFLVYAAPFAAVVTGHRRAALAMLGAVTAGVLLGAALTLQPWSHLTYNVLHVFKTMGTTPGHLRVSELQPSYGEASYVVWMAILMLGWATLPELRALTLRHAGVTTALAGWVLAFTANRFWSDIGLPALLALTALLLERVLQARLPARSGTRGVLVAAVAAALFLSITSNLVRRWESSPLPQVIRLADDEVGEEWLPGDGGIVYSTEMRIFYSMYLIWPDAGWNYVLGLEQGIMPRDDLAVLHDFKETGSWDSLQPWVDALRPEDRIIVSAEGRDLPEWEGTISEELPYRVVVVRRAEGQPAEPSAAAAPSAEGGTIR